MTETSQMDLKGYWHIILRRKYIFIAVSMIFMSVIVWGSLFLPEVYEAESTVFIEKNVINRLVKNIAITPSIEDRMNVITYAMKSRSLLFKVIDELDMDVDSENPVDVKDIVAKLQKRTVIETIGKRSGSTDLFKVTYRDSDPVLARDYVNTLVNRYVEENLSAKREESYEANRFLTEQINFFKKKLDKAEKKITDFRRQMGIFIAMDESTVVHEIKIAQDGIETIKLQRMELEAKKKMTEGQLKKEKPYTVAMYGKMTGDSLNNRVIVLQKKLNDLLVKYTENYPEVIRVKAELMTLQKRIEENPENSNEEEETARSTNTEMATLNPLYQQLKEEMSRIDLELAALSAKEKHLTSRIKSKKTYLKDIPVEKKKLSDLERERDSYKNINEELVIKLGQSEVSKQMEIQDKTETFRIVDPAVLPTKPVSPDRVMLIILGIISGIAGGFGFVFLLDYMDDSVKSVDALKTLVNLPVLAAIPVIDRIKEVNRRKRIDRAVYSASILYLSVIGAFLVKELINKFI